MILQSCASLVANALSVLEQANNLRERTSLHFQRMFLNAHRLYSGLENVSCDASRRISGLSLLQLVRRTW